MAAQEPTSNNAAEEKRSLGNASHFNFNNYSGIAPGTLGPEFDAHLLLGVDCAHLDSYEPVVDDRHMKTGLSALSNTGMAVVIPAWKLAELLNCEELKAMREKDRREMRKKDQGNAVLDSAEKPKSQRTRER